MSEVPDPAAVKPSYRAVASARDHCDELVDVGTASRFAAIGDIDVLDARLTPRWHGIVGGPSGSGFRADGRGVKTAAAGICTCWENRELRRIREVEIRLPSALGIELSAGLVRSAARGAVSTVPTTYTSLFAPGRRC